VADFDVVSEFDVNRRVGWDGTEDLAHHIDTVVDLLHQSDAVTGIEVDADLDTGRVRLAMSLTSWENNRAEHSRAIVGVAIRGARARHEGLLPELEISGAGADDAAWSGLRGPTWRLLRFELDSSDDR
jgi:hypothetical protein